MTRGWIAVLATVACLAHPALAASLSSEDTNLGRVKAVTLRNGLSVAVDLGDDTPLAAHVIARFQNNQPLMLGRDGLWAPWDGSFAHIDEAATQTADKKLIFHIFDTLPDDLFYPVSFTVVYRTANGIKSGTLTVDGP